MGCFEMWKYESGSWVFKNQFLNPTVKTGHGNDTGEFFGGYLSMDYAGTSLIVSNTGNDFAGDDYGRVVLYGAGSLPSLTYDGLNSLKVTGAETSSYITYKAYESNKFLACGTDLTTYPLSKTGNYKAEIAGSNTFTLTSNVLVPATNIVPLYQYPPTDGTTSGVTETVTADENSIWTVSGAGYGNGLYHAQASVAATSTSVTAYHAFDNNLTAGFETTSSTIGTLRVQLPSAETIHKYVVWPKAADGNRPKSWTIEGSQDGTSWTTIHTVTDSPPSLTGDAHEITSPGAYVYYRINVTANNGGTGLDIAELALYGDVAFSITFSDGWVTTNGSNVIPLGSSYTLPTYTSSLPVTVTGAGDFDVNTAGTYRVVYTSIGIDELARRVVRRFVVEYPTIAFHYGNFYATDYGGIYSTKEAAAADGFIYADTANFTNETFGNVATNVTVVQEWTTTTITMQNTILEIPKFGRNEVNKGIILEFPNLTSEVPNSGNNGFNLLIRKYTGVGGTQYHKVQIGAVSGNSGAGNIYISPSGPGDVPFGNFDYIKVWLTIDNKVKRTVSVNNTISTGEWDEYNDDQPWQIEFTGFQGTTSNFTFRYKYLDNTGEVTSDPN